MVSKNKNQAIMNTLRQYARQLAEDGNNIYRIQAYRRAAESIDRLQEPVVELVRREGMQGLKRLPHIGASLSRTIANLANDDWLVANDETGAGEEIGRVAANSEAGKDVQL